MTQQQSGQLSFGIACMHACRGRVRQMAAALRNKSDWDCSEDPGDQAADGCAAGLHMQLRFSGLFQGYRSSLCMMAARLVHAWGPARL